MSFRFQRGLLHTPYLLAKLYACKGLLKSKRVLHPRPADKDGALEGSLMIGVPAGAATLPEKSLSYYIVMLKPGARR